MRNLTWRPTDGGEPLFETFDFVLRAGERVSLIGPSGAGKSTLLRCLVGLEDRETGRLEWRGTPVEGRHTCRYRRRVAYLQQEPVDIAGTLEANLEFARKMATAREEIEPLDAEQQRALLDAFGLSGIDGGRRFSDLSVGERQRAALVRTLTLRPAVLLLDEPTAALDPDRAGQIEEHVLDYLENGPGEALVWVSHSRELADRIATRLVELDGA